MIRESTLCERVHSASSHEEESEEITQKRAKERGEKAMALARCSWERAWLGVPSWSFARPVDPIATMLMCVCPSRAASTSSATTSSLCAPHMAACSIGVWPIGVGRLRVNTMPVCAECVIYLLVTSFCAWSSCKIIFLLVLHLSSLFFLFSFFKIYSDGQARLYRSRVTEANFKL